MVEHRVAIGVAETDLASYQRAVRVLLTKGIVTATRPGADDLNRVRRWARDLAHDLEALAAYRLEVSQSAVRLVRRLDRLDATHPLTTDTQVKRPFDRRRYAYLCLCLSALGRAGTQIALTDLATHVRTMASEIEGLGFDPDKHSQRIAFVDAVVELEGIGAIIAADGSTSSWHRDPESGDALYDIDREVCHLMFLPGRVVQHVRSVADFLDTALPAGRDPRRFATRQRLTRLLLEHPVVYYADLSEAERQYLHREGRDLSVDLTRLTGAQLERRAEGMALIDTAASFSDRRFPATGAGAHVALLLAERLAMMLQRQDAARENVAYPSAMDAQAQGCESIDRALPSLGHVELFAVREGSVATPEPEVQAEIPARCQLFSDRELEDIVAEIVAKHRSAIPQDYRNAPALLAGEALQWLERFDLARRVQGGWVALPAMARYRHVVVVVRPRGNEAAAEEGG